MVKIEFKEGSAINTALQARIDAMKELKEKSDFPKKDYVPRNG